MVGTHRDDTSPAPTVGANLGEPGFFLALGCHEPIRAGETLARVIPEREAWLYKNPKALAAMRRGLAQARARRFANAAAGGQR